MRYGFVKNGVLVALCTVLLAGAAMCEFHVYSTQQKKIKAAVVVDDGAVVPASPPYLVFFVLDQRMDLKPLGWEFYNPLAQGNLKPGQWEYWYLKISAPIADFAKYDVLYFPMASTCTLNRERREKLRKFVDSGGVLWIENLGSAQFDVNGTFFISNLQFENNGGQAPLAGVPADARAHSLVNRPYSITQEDVNKLGMGDASDVGLKLLAGLSGGVPDERYFASIVTDHNGLIPQGIPIVSAAEYGSGHIVVSAVPIGQAISNQGGYADEDLRFAYNIISWGSEHTTEHKNPRHPGYSFDEIGMPLASKWECSMEAEFGGATNEATSSPVILDDMVFQTFTINGAGGNETWLYAFDLSPWRDRDGNGDTDDGREDNPKSPYDVLWCRKIASDKTSSPTVAYVPIGGGAVVPGVFVTLLDGSVIAIDAADYTGNTPPSPTTIIPAASMPFTTEIPAPIYMDGTVYVGDEGGFLHGYNFFESDPMKQLWVAPTPPAFPLYAGPAKFSPIIGCVRDPGTGVVDQLVYLAKDDLSPANGVVEAYPLRTFNEVLVPVPNTPDTGRQYRPRSAQGSIGSSQIGDWELWYSMADGVMVDIGSRTTPGPAQLNNPSTFQIDLTSVPNLPPGAPIIAYYELAPGVAPGLVPRGNPIIPKTSSPGGVPATTGINATPAFGKNDIMYFSTENGSFYAVQESGRGSPRTIVKWRWYLEDLGVGAYGIPNTSTVVGPPAATNDMVYYALNGGTNGYILAFSADPVFTLYTGKPIDRGKPVTISVVDQMNDKTKPVQFGGGTAEETANSGASYLIDYQAGEITFVNFRSGNNPMTDISSSQDIFIKFTPSKQLTPEDQTPGIEEEQIHAAFPIVSEGIGSVYYPNDRWNNLVWYLTFPTGQGPTSPPTLMGDVLYVGCADGFLRAVDVEKLRQRNGARLAPVQWDATSGIMWEQPIGSTDQPITGSIAGSHGHLAVSCDKGLVVMHNPVTLVADGNRLVELDASGNLVWSLDSTKSYVATSTNVNPPQVRYALINTPLNHPAVARRTQFGTILVADTGNNRIVEINRQGIVIREVKSFVDPSDTTNGIESILPSGSPLTLNKPMDVSMSFEELPHTDPEWQTENDRVYHYLIADSGNYRVIKVDLRYVNGMYQQPRLVWITKSTLEGKKYQYMSARPIRNVSNPTGQTDMICVISNFEAQDTGLEGPGGVLVNVKYSTEPGLPESRIGAIDKIITELTDGTNTYKLHNPTFFSREYRTIKDYSDVIVDSGGLYLRDIQTDASGNVTSEQVLRFTETDYRKITKLYFGTPEGKPFAPVYAQILPNGNVLVTNKAMGTMGNLQGEIVELLPSSTGGTNWKIIWPSLTTQVGANSYDLRQPSSAERMPY